MATAAGSSQQAPTPLFWSQVVSLIRTIPRTAILSMVGPFLLCIFSYFGWLYYGAPKLDIANYGLTKENILITQQPGWLRKTRVLDEVFDESSLARRSRLDSKTPEELFRVFTAHPCVRKTRRVEMMAGIVRVDLEYRIPVAMVNCNRPDESNPMGKEEGYLPIDSDGVLLDTKNFTRDDVPQYITIFVEGEKVDSARVMGKPIGDPRVEEAVQLCNLLLPYRSIAKIRSVYVYKAKHSGKSKWLLEIETLGPRFVWGSSPRLEGLGEPLAETKLNQLVESVSDSKIWSQPSIDLTGTRR